MVNRVSFVIANDAVMKTDVISQPIHEEIPDGTCYLGELIVNQEQVRRQAKQYNVSEAEEMARVVAHGVLHLLGYTDDTQDKRNAMQAIEDSVIRRLNLVQPKSSAEPRAKN